MKRKNSIAFVTLSALLIQAWTGSALAQTGSISTDAPRPAQTGTAHKPKMASHPKKQTPDSLAEQKTAPATIPMDFSGMARRPVDLPSESEASKAKPNEEFQPGLGTNSSGGISPGMNMKF